MDRITIAQLYADANLLGGTNVNVAGWIRSVRDMKNFGFVTLNDGSCFKDLQVVMSRETLANYEEVAHAGLGAALRIMGPGWERDVLSRYATAVWMACIALPTNAS